MEDLDPWIKVVTTDAGRTEPRVRWGDGYAVIALRESGQEHDLPGIDVALRRGDVSGKRDVMIIGERSGGVRDFLDWWRDALDAQDIPWLFVHAGEWAQDLVRRSAARLPGEDSAGGAKAASQRKALDPIAALGRPVSAAEKAEFLLRWAGAWGAPASLIIRVTGNDIEDSTIQAFRMIREGNKCPNLHLVIGTETESNFMDGAFWSGYLAVTSGYRLRPFGASEARKLLEWHGDRRKNRSLLSDRAMEELLDCTGGQPLLVQSLVQRIVDRPGGSSIDEMEVRKVFQHMKQSPPDAVRIWQSDLRTILMQRPELISAMRSYVTGLTLGPARFPPPAQERPLMVSGWVKLNRLGRWGIASQLHASLARPVLDELSPG